MPSSYQTKCFDYTKLGCESRDDCIRKCQINMALRQCDSLPLDTMIEKDDFTVYMAIFNVTPCLLNSNYTSCKVKFTSFDCVNEYYTFKPVVPVPLNNESFKRKFLDLWLNETSTGMKNDYAKFTRVEIFFFGDEPDTIYRHSPAQHPVEFVTFLCGVISLWTGFSVMSMYAYGKRLFNGQMELNPKMNLFPRKTKSVSIIKNIYN